MYALGHLINVTVNSLTKTVMYIMHVQMVKFKACYKLLEGYDYKLVAR